MYSDGRINTESSLRSYFHDAILRASRENQLEVCEHTHWYLTNLLYSYSRTDQFFDHRADGGKLTPLAEYYRLATEAQSEHERRQYLQRLGDVAIVVSGLFAAALRRKAVGVNYYMAMGENAYGVLADANCGSSKDQALAEIFDDLSSHFGRFVSLLSSIGKNTNPSEDLLSLFDRWQNTGEPKLEQALRKRGVMIPTTVVTH